MKAPMFSLPYINNNGIYHLQDDIGKVIVLTFWASWCPDCGHDLPKKEQLFQSMDTTKVRMITINVTGRERDQSAGPAYTEKYLSQPTLADRGTEIYENYQCKGVPTTVIINQNGDIHDQFGDNAKFLEIVTSVGTLVGDS
ncbi:TlpA disulfide reductase family protein [Aquibacillus sediminis]|uniref:TlpA disulfide reductase family protein n=1 Tax=Aquibacillus sediminis TaxID=2574734 RepID=UPI001109A93C|nr:TlpA disulfide reductase family protein [Aquibacillus sediminis]